MSEAFDAIYGVVNRAFCGFSPTQILENAVRSFDISFYADRTSNTIQEAAMEYTRPSVLMRPKVYPDGDIWCALYGDDLQSGVAGFGKSPSEAMYDFDKKWTEKK